MAALGQEGARGELLPPSVRTLLLARLAPLSQAARHLVQVSAVLGTAASAQLLWQLAELGVQAGVEALEEAVRSGILREGEAGVGRLGSYRFSHELLRDVVYTELGAARRQVLHQRALALLQSEGARAAELAVHALATGEAEEAYRSSVQAGDEAVAVFAVEDAIGHYEQARAWLQEQKWLQTALAAAEVERLYAHLGRAYANQNAWEKAQEAYEELLAYAQHHQLPTLVSLTFNRLAILALQQSKDKRQVQALLEEARQMAQTSSDQRALTETAWNLAQITGTVWEDSKGALSHGEQALSLARTIHDQELEARSLCTLGVIHLLAGDLEEAMHALEAALALYAALGNEQAASRELSDAHVLSGAPPTQRHHHIHQTASFHPLPFFAIGAPLTQPLTNRATEALCWGDLALAQLYAGQVQHSIRSGHRALALSKEIKNVWAQGDCTLCLTPGLLDTGEYEEALGLTQDTMALARTLPSNLLLQSFLLALGRTYHALQQWEEARSTLEEAEAMAERLDYRPLRVSVLSQLCMNCAVAGQWGQAHTYALKSMAVRESFDRAMFLLDLSRPYETEALLRAGDEQQARAAMHRLGERLGPYQRYRIPYLQSLAVLAAWDGHSEQAIGHLREAAGLAAEIGLPGELRQIQAALGTVYEAGGEPAQAHTAWASAAQIIGGLAEGIKDEARRARFLAGPQIQPVLQQVQSEASPVSKDHAEPSGR